MGFAQGSIYVVVVLVYCLLVNIYVFLPSDLISVLLFSRNHYIVVAGRISGDLFRPAWCPGDAKWVGHC